MKKISIIIPTFNRAHLITDTLNCVLKQTYANWECIIVDDGSDDNTDQIVSTFVDRDNRFKFFKRSLDRLKGASSCRNLGLEKSTGDYIQFLDSDDLLSPNKLQSQLEVLTNSPKDSIATCEWGRFHNIENLKVKSGFKSYRNFDKGVELLMCFGKNREFFPQMVYLLPKTLIQLTGNWNESLSNNDDGEFYTRIILKCSSIVFVKNASVFYRENSNDKKLSNLNSKKSILSAIKSWSLIEQHIYQAEGFKKTLYVENAKNYIFNEIKQNFLWIVLKNSLFFRIQLINKIFKK